MWFPLNRISHLVFMLHAEHIHVYMTAFVNGAFGTMVLINLAF